MFKNLKLKIILLLFGAFFWLFGFKIAQSFYKAQISDLKTAHANELLKFTNCQKKQNSPCLFRQGLGENDEKNN